MTASAWIMLLCVWGVVLFFSAYFLWRVFTLPQRTDDSQQ